MRDPFGRVPVEVSPALVRLANVATVAGLVALFAVDRVRGDVLAFFAIGGGIGIATCIPIGIANVIVIDSAYRHGAVRAVGAAIGGSLADGLYASAGIFGIGPLLTRSIVVPQVLYAVSGCVLVGYGYVLARSRPLLAAPVPPSRGDRHLARGIAVGLAATLLNPSAIITWIVIVGSHAAGTTPLQGAAWVAGIVAGTFAWFLVVVALALRGRRVLRDRSAWLTRVLALIVIVTGALSLARAARLVWSH